MEVKKLQRSEQAHFLALPKGSLRFWIRSLPLARVLPNVSLLAGYHLVHKYSWIFALGHYLFLKAHSSLKENYLLLGTDNVREQIPEAIVYTTQWPWSGQAAWFEVQQTKHWAPGKVEVRSFQKPKVLSGVESGELRDILRRVWKFSGTKVFSKTRKYWTYLCYPQNTDHQIDLKMLSVRIKHGLRTGYKTKTLV